MNPWHPWQHHYGIEESWGYTAKKISPNPDPFSGVSWGILVVVTLPFDLVVVDSFLDDSDNVFMGGGGIVVECVYPVFLHNYTYIY